MKEKWNTILTFVKLMTLAGVFVGMLPSVTAWAQPKKGGGSKPYRLVPLSLEQGTAFGMNEAVLANNNVTVELVGELEYQPCHWTVTATNASQTMTTTLLQGDLIAGSAVDINNAGMIVGYGVSSLGKVHSLVWLDSSAPPTVLPLPDGLTGNIQATNINNTGVILGTINGHVPDGTGGVQNIVGIIAWQYSFDANAALVISSPTWFEFSNQQGLKIGLNDAGWITLTDDLQAHRYQLVWSAGQYSLAAGGGAMFSSGVQWAQAGGINQAGDAAVYYRANNSSAHTLVARRLDGTNVSFPKFASKRDQVDEINQVRAINDVTDRHGLQVLGNVGWFNTRYGSYQNPRPAIWESGGSVRLLEDITTLPSDANYTFKRLTVSMYDLNNASWICGFVQREASGQWSDVPAVLIHNP